MTRRTKCHLVGKRAGMLNFRQAAEAWYALAEKVSDLGDVEGFALPKFKHLLGAIRSATIQGRKDQPDAIPDQRGVL